VSAGGSYIETEIKLRCEGGAEAARRILYERGYPLVEPRLFEANQLFDRPGGELQRSNQLIRLRRTGTRAIVTYKGPTLGGPHKSREEIEFDASDADAFTRVLERLGYRPGFRYEKFRTKFAAAGEPGFITLDETPIGVFLELEGPPEWIDRSAADLGFAPAQYLTASYASLYREHRQTHDTAPQDMIFPEGRKS
jgi:adenylate cyclase class 2